METTLYPMLESVTLTAAQDCRALRWDDANQCWWWASATQDVIFQWSDEGDARKHKRLEPAQSLAPTTSSGLLLASSKRLCLLLPSSRQQPFPNVLATVDAADPRTIIGNGRTDRQGNFVFGTWNIAPDRRQIGSFFQYSQHYGLRRLALPTVTQAGSICFSGDGKTMYFSCAFSNVLMQCRYDFQSALVDDVRPLAAAGSERRMIDAIVDCAGNIWSLQAESGNASYLVRYSPHGEQMYELTIGSKEMTSVGFGGTALQTLALIDVNGNLHMLSEHGSTGLPDAPFNDRSFAESYPPKLPNPMQPVQLNGTPMAHQE